MKIKFNTNFYDEVEGVFYEPSTDFVEVPKHVEDRVSIIMELDERHLNSFEYDKPTSAKKPTDKQPKK